VLDASGNTLDASMLKGHPSLLFFGYTHCPDVCPTTLAEMAAWFETLGDEGKALKGYFVTVDPERDTPAIIGDYVAGVTDRVTPISGDPAEVLKLVNAWKVTVEKVPGDSDDYTLNHTASVFLINADGGFEGTIAFGENAESAVGKIRKLLAKS
jgi:protein SCO1/2